MKNTEHIGHTFSVDDPACISINTFLYSELNLNNFILTYCQQRKGWAAPLGCKHMGIKQHVTTNQTKYAPKGTCSNRQVA